MPQTRWVPLPVGCQFQASRAGLDLDTRYRYRYTVGMTTATERKYALTRVATGDYLLPSNDLRTLWRIFSYVDGPSFGLDDWPRDKTLWRLMRWTGETNPGSFVDVSLDDRRWAGVADGFATRREAIEDALSR